ncbi:MAG: hypothetical protein M1834_007195 [Cirrosporium novae-zelandiae]|nr:MAG: hypothetical protein M1834_007195 [Cirrosporium novae-zelandiae]
MAENTVAEPSSHSPPADTAPSPSSKAIPEDSKPINLAADAPKESASEATNMTELTESKTNGVADHPETTEKPTTTIPTDTQDTEMKDDPEPKNDTDMKDAEQDSAPASVAEPASAEANGTPTSKKGGTRRKSAGGVPEHKTKKLNKKKSKMLVTHLDAKPGDYFFARLKSYPPWPSVICDEEMLPQSLLSTRPVTTRRPDGTFKEGYGDGEKRMNERTFPVMFLQTNEFAWIPNTDLTPLKLEDVQDFNEKGKSKVLIKAYNVAAEQNDLQHFKELLADHQRALIEDQKLREEKAASKVAKKRKSKEAVEAEEPEEDVEMADFEVEDEEPEPKPKSSKKRKKGADSDGEPEKPAKTIKTATKLKLSTPKTPTTTERKKPAARGSRKSNIKAADKETPEASKTPSERKRAAPPETPQTKEKNILYLRHRLQRGFLTRDVTPKEAEMAEMDKYLNKLETYPDLEVSIIRATKVHKVLRGIIKLPSEIPKEQEFNFKQRSAELLGLWNKTLEHDPAHHHHEHQDTPKDEATETNGSVKEERMDDRAKTETSATPAQETTASPEPIKEEDEADDADDADENKAEETSAAESPAEAEKSAEEDTKTSAPDTGDIPENENETPAEAAEDSA